MEVYVDLLSRSLPAEYEPLLYFPDRNADARGHAVQLYDVRRDQRTLGRFAKPLTPNLLREPEREAWFGRLLHEHRIDLVHFQHLMGHPWSLPLVARSQGIPTLLTVMDFFPVCSHLNLITAAGRYCHAPQQSLSACDMCLGEQDHLLRFSQANRRAFIGGVLRTLDAIVSLSQSTEDILLKIYPDLRHQRRYVEGLPVPDRRVPKRQHWAANERLRVAVPGNFARQKGAATLCKVFEAMRHEPIEFHVFGHADAQAAAWLRCNSLPNVIIHGKYDPAVAAQQLTACDVSLMLSIWPETYVLTLSESWQAGLVPIVTDIGALGERVRHGENGFKVPVDEPGAVVHLLRAILADRGSLTPLRRDIGPEDYRSLADHLRNLTGIYDSLIAEFAVHERGDAFFALPPGVPRPLDLGTRARRASWHTGSGELPTAGPTMPGLGSSPVGRVVRHVRTHGWRMTIVPPWNAS